MAEQQDDKSRLPLTGIFTLVAIVSSFLIYEGISLKTSRPIDKEIASKGSLEKGVVQARLWQDPFEAVETHRLQEAKQLLVALAALPWPDSRTPNKTQLRRLRPELYRICESVLGPVQR